MKRFLFLIGLFLICCESIQAQPEDQARNVSDAWTFGIQFENDLFGDTDEQYTNGVQISWASPDLTEYRDSEQLPNWSHGLIQLLPFINEPGLQRSIAFVLGQKIFTPNDISRPELIDEDRPYAGWLYGGVAFHNKNRRRLDTFEIQLGLIGPVALGEETQDFVHDLRDIAKAQGWNNELDNELGFALIYERKWRIYQSKNIHRFGFDAITHAGATVGTVYTHANAGVEVRVGWNIPSDFGTSLIRPGGESAAPTDSSDPRFAGKHGFSAHLYAALDGRVIGRDIFLDGNTFESSHSVDKEHLVGDLVVGAGLIWNRFKLTYAQVFRTQEFEGQGDDHSFGSVSLSFTY